MHYVGGLAMGHNFSKLEFCHHKLTDPENYLWILFWNDKYINKYNIYIYI